MTAYDGCLAGIDGRCNHVTSTLFALEEFFKQTKGPKGSVNPSLTPAPSSTSKPCVWNVPRKQKVDNLSIIQVKFKKHQHGKPVKGEDKSSLTSDARPQNQHHAHSNTTLCSSIGVGGTRPFLQRWSHTNPTPYYFPFNGYQFLASYFGNLYVSKYNSAFIERLNFQRYIDMITLRDFFRNTGSR